MKDYLHNCIKCKQSYSDTDPEPYYCENCNKERLEIAKKIDAQMAHRPKRETVSELQMFEQIAKSKGGAGNNFVNVRDLGLI